MGKYKIMYVVGGGHSGSTLLDMVIGSSEKCFSTGELFYLDYYGKDYKRKTADSKEGICACTDELHSCEFWTKVKGDKGKQIIKGRSMMESLFAMKSLLTPFRFFQLKIKQSKNKELYDSIYEEAVKIKPGLKYIVESSKDPRRLYDILQDPEIDNNDVQVIHLVKDGRGYVYSYQKGVRGSYGLSVRPFLLLMMEWILINIVSRAAIFKYGLKSMRVSYDLFAQQPDKTIADLNAKMDAGIDPANYISKMAAERYHIVDGNRMKFIQVESIRYDSKWRREMGGFKKAVLSVLLYPFNAIWVYR